MLCRTDEAGTYRVCGRVRVLRAYFLCIGVFVFLRRPGMPPRFCAVLRRWACYGVLGYYSPFWDFRIFHFSFAIPPVKVISAVLCMHFVPIDVAAISRYGVGARVVCARFGGYCRLCGGTGMVRPSCRYGMSYRGFVLLRELLHGYCRCRT